MKDEKNNSTKGLSQITERIHGAQRETLGVLNQEFLMQSIGSLLRKEPLCLDQNCSVKEAVNEILDKKAGSCLLVNESKQVVGIFTERDYLKHFARGEKDPAITKLSEVSTIQPVLVKTGDTLAHALNLMSLGGFRHLPVIDDHGRALGVVSVRDVIDKISDSLVNDLLSFPVDS